MFEFLLCYELFGELCDEWFIFDLSFVIFLIVFSFLKELCKLCKRKFNIIRLCYLKRISSM